MEGTVAPFGMKHEEEEAGVVRERGRMCLVVPVRKCFPDVVAAVVATCYPALEVRRRTTLITLGASDEQDPEGRYEGRDLGDWLGNIHRPAEPAVLSLRMPEDSHGSVLRWAADLADASELLVEAGQHVIVVTPSALPPYEELFAFFTAHVADGVIAVANTLDLTFPPRWLVDLDPDRGALLTYGDPSELISDLALPRHHLGTHDDARNVSFHLKLASPLGLWELTPDLGGPAHDDA